MSDRIEELFGELESNTLGPEACDELAERLEKSEDWSGLTRFYELRALSAESDEARLDYYRKAAEVAEVSEENFTKAVELLGHTLVGSDEEILSTLGRMRALLSRLADWENWLEVAENEVQLIGDTGLAVELLLEMGNVAASELDDLPKALDCFQQAFGVDSTCFEALALARQIFEYQEDWSSMFELFQVELDQTDDVQRSAELLCEMGEVALNIGANEDAQTCFEAALNAVSDYERALEGIKQLESGDVSASGESAVEHDGSGDTEAYAEQGDLEAPDKNTSSTEESPTTQEPVLAETEHLSTLADDRETLAVAALDENAHLESDEANLDVSVQGSDTEMQPAVSESDTVAVTATEETEAETEEAQAARLEKFESLMDEAAMSEPEQQIELLCSAAQIGQNDAAARAYLMAVQTSENPFDVYLSIGNKLQLNRESAEQLSQQIAALAEVNPEAEGQYEAHALLIAGSYYEEARKVDQGLRELGRKDNPEAVKAWQVQWYLQTGKWRNAQQAVSENIEGSPNDVRLIGLKIMGSLAEERMGDVEKAVGFWRQAFQMAPDDEQVRGALIKLYPLVEKWKEYGAVLKAELDDTPNSDIERRCELIRALIPVAIEHLRQDQMVVSLYEELLEYEPSDLEAREALAQRFEKMRNYPKLVAFYRDQMTDADDDEQLELKLRVADIYLSKMRNQVEAIAAYEDVLESHPANLDALSALDSLYEKRRAWEEFVQIRLRMAEVAPDLEAQLEQIRDLARYAEKKIRQPQLTLSLWQHVLELEPNDGIALAAIVSLYEQTKDWHGLLETVSQMQGADIDEKVLSTCLAKAGSVATERLNDPEAALPFWSALAALEPDNRRVVESYKKVLVDLHMWDELEDFLGSTEKWTDLVRVFESQSAQEKIVDQQVELLLKAARVYEEELQLEDKAARILERIIVLDASHVETLRRLKAFYESKDDLRKLSGILPNLIELEDDEDIQLDLQFQNARICLKSLRNPNMALEALKPLVMSRPFYEGVLELLQEIGRQSRQWDAVAELLALGADEPDSAPSVERYIEQVTELAGIYAEKLRNDGESIRRYQQILEHDDSNVVALDALEKLYQSTERWFELLQILEVRIELTELEDERVKLIERQALLFEERVEDLPSAIDAYLRLVEEFGRHASRIEALRRLYNQTEQYAQLYGLLSDYVEDVEKVEDVKSLQLELARLAMDHLNDHFGAVEHFKIIVEQQVDDKRARQGLEELLKVEDVRGAVAEVLRPIYEQLKSWPALVSVLEILVRESDDDAEKTELLEALCMVLREHVSEPQQALAVQGTLLQMHPSNEAYLEQCLTLAKEASLWSECSQILEQVSNEVDDGAVRVVILKQLGAVYETEQSATAMAIDAYRRVCEEEPNDEHALSALARLLYAAEQWAELLEIYRIQLENAGSIESKQAKRFQMAELLEEFLSDAAQAIDLYLEILAEDGEDETALKSVSRLFAFEEMWAELADVLETRISIATSEEEKRELYLELAEVRELRLSEIDSALEIYAEVVAEHQENERVRHALERLLNDESVKGQAARLLEPVYLGNQDYRGLILALSILQEQTDDPDESIQYLERIFEAQETKLNQPKDAFYTLFAALTVDSSREDILEKLLSLTESLDVWSEFAERLESIAAEGLDSAVSSRLFVQLGLTYRDKLHLADEARRFFEAALEREETNFEAFSYLDELFTQSVESEALTALLLRRAEVEDDQDRGISLRLRAASVLDEQMQEPSRAIDVYQRVLADDDHCVAAIEALERLFRTTERWQDYLALLEMRIEQLAGQDEVLGLWFQVAETYERELNDLQGAVAAYEAILEQAPDSLDALRKVDRLYELLEQWDDQLSVLQRQVELIDDPAVRTNLSFRAAHLQDTRLMELEAALEGYQAVLARDANHEQCLSRLETWVRENRELAPALNVLMPQLEANEDWSRLIANFEASLVHLDILDDRIETNQKIAAIFEEKLEDPRQAFQVLGRALQDDMTRVELLDELERLSSVLDNWDSLIDLIDQSLERLPNAFSAKELNARLARLCEAHRSDLSFAISYHQKVLEVEPDNEITLSSLDSLYQRTEDWTELGHILEQRAQFADDDDVRIGFLYRLGMCRVEYLQDFVGAVTCFEQVLEQSPTHSETVSALEEMFARNEERQDVATLLEASYLESGDFRKLHDNNAILVEEADDEHTRLNLLLSLAELAESKLEEPPLAYRWYADAFVLQPADEELREKAESYAGQLNRYENWSERLSMAINRCDDDMRRLELAVEIGIVEFKQLRRVENAQSAMRFVIDELDPVNPDALAVLDEIYQQTEQVGPLIDVLRLRADVLVEDEDRIKLKLRLGRLLWDTDQKSEAVNTYEDVVELDSTCSAALEALVELYLESGRWNELLETYQKQTAVMETGPNQAVVFAKMARLASETLERPEDAIEHWGEVLRIRGEDREALLALESLYTQTEGWRDLVDVLERQVHLVEGNTARELEIYIKLGQIWGDELDREEKSIENWQKVLELEPSQEPAKWALLSLYERSDRFADFLSMGSELIELLDGGSEAEQELARKLARVATDELKSSDSGIKYWSRIYAVNEADDEALNNLEELYTSTQDWSNCADILQTRAKLCTQEFEQTAAWFRVAEVAHDRLDDSDMRQMALKNVLDIDSQNIDALQQLEDSYDACEMWEEKVGLLLQRLETTADSFEQGDLFEGIAGLFEERLGSTESAFEVYLQALDATKDHERFLPNLERLAELPDQWSQIVALTEAIMGNSSTRIDHVEMRLKTANWSREHLRDAARAAGHFRLVLEADPTSLAALVALGEIYEQEEGWGALASILEARINLEDDEGLVKELCLKLAGILDGRLGREQEAVNWYRRALDYDAENLDILAALEGALTVLMNWSELADVFERQIEAATDDGSRFEKQIALAELFENQLNDGHRAVGVYQELLENGSTVWAVLNPLKRLLSAQQRWYELVDLYPICTDSTTDVDLLTELYTEWADVQLTRLSDEDGALDTLRKLFELLPENLDTVSLLDELYRGAERFDELADLYVLHLAALTEPSQIEFALTTVATLFVETLEEPNRARAILDDYLEKVSPLGDAMLMLLEICESSGDFTRRSELLEILIDAMSPGAERIQRQAELAGLYLNHLSAEEKSEQLYRQILGQDPHHVATLRALTGFAKRRGEWSEAIEMTQLAEVHAKTLEDKSAALYEIGSIHAQHLGDMTTALDYFEQAADVWPGNHLASDLLIGHYWESENWIRLDPLLRSWLTRNESNRLDEPQYFERCKQMAICSEMLGDETTALDYVRLALEIDRTDLDTLEQSGRLLVKSGALSDASTTYLTILAHHRDGLAPEKAASVYQNLGRIKGRQGEMRKALDFFRKALDVDPGSQDTQRALIELHMDRGDWNDVVGYQRALLESLTNDEDRFELFINLAETYSKHLQQPKLAVECLEQAQGLNSDSRIVLGKLMELHEHNHDWSALVQVLQQLAELEPAPERKAKIWCAIAVHQQQHLEDRFTAVRSFDKALDFEPTYLEAFEAIANILNEDRDYARQDRYYRKMLKRALENKLDDNLVFTLGKGLGEINRTRLKNYSEAVKAYKIALARKPDDVDTHQILAQLYELEDDTEAAIAQYAILLKYDPRNVETYRNMKKLYMEVGRFDEAWCVCQALCFLQVATDEEKEFFVKRRGGSLRGNTQLSAQDWALLNHPAKSQYLDQLLSILYPILMPAMSRNLKDFGLHKRKSLVDPKLEIPVNVVFSHVQKLTGLMRPTLYQGMANVQSLINLNTNPPGVAIGKEALQPSNIQSLCFDVARASFLNAHPYLLASIPEDVDYKARQVRVKKTLYSLMKVINPGSAVESDPGLVELFSTQLQADGLRVVSKLLGEMSQDAASHLDATRWLDGVDLTADRLGLLCSNDLGHAINAIQSGPCNVGKHEMTEKIKELIVFSVSPQYMKLRKSIGVAQS